MYFTPPLTPHKSCEPGYRYSHVPNSPVAGEARQLAVGLAQKHGASAAELAVLAHISLSALSALPLQHSTTKVRLLELQRAALLALMAERGVPLDAVIAATRGLVDAGVTLRYLMSLPA